MTRKLIPILPIVMLLFARVVGAGEFQDDLKARRTRLMERLGPEVMLVSIALPPPANRLHRLAVRWTH